MSDYSDKGIAVVDWISREALRLHDLRHGRDHCDRKYVLVCPSFAAALFDAASDREPQPPSR